MAAAVSGNGDGGNGSRKQHQTTHSANTQTRVQRRMSRSTTHRAASRSLSSSRKDSSASFSHSQPWHVESNPHCNGGLKNAVDSVRNRLRRKLWVGTLGTNTDSLKESLRRNMEWRMKDQYDSLPVWIPDAEFASCYDEFCHQVLWPCLHYAIPDAPKTKSFYESGSFKQYVAVNQRFADAIVATYQEGDIIWVNDYHLMLLPGLRSLPLFATPLELKQSGQVVRLRHIHCQDCNVIHLALILWILRKEHLECIDFVAHALCNTTQ